MKKFMIVYTCDGNPCATFADTFSEVHDLKLDLECGLGVYTEIYERVETEYGGEYRLVC